MDASYVAPFSLPEDFSEDACEEHAILGHPFSK